MLLTEIADARINWAVISAWHSQTPRREGVHLITTFASEGAIYAGKYSWVALYLWCFVRSQGFRSRDWIERWDCARLGKNYLTSKEGVRDAAKEFAKYSSLEDLPKEESEPLLKEFQALRIFAESYNPEANSPAVGGPVPIRPLPPLPVEPEAPEEEVRVPNDTEPSPVAPPAPPAPPEKRWLRLPGWLKFMASFAVGAVAGAGDKILDSIFGPADYAKIIKQILDAILSWG